MKMKTIPKMKRTQKNEGDPKNENDPKVKKRMGHRGGSYPAVPYSCIHLFAFKVFT